MALSDRQEQFVCEYVQCWNASEAARRAGYSERTAGQQGYRLLQNDAVQTLIKEVLRAKTMSAEEALARLTDQARFDMGPFLDELGDIDLEAVKLAGLSHLIKRIWKDQSGRRRVEFHDGQRALEMIGKAHGLFVDRSFTTPVPEDFDLDAWREERRKRLAAVEALPAKPDGIEAE